MARTRRASLAVALAAAALGLLAALLYAAGLSAAEIGAALARLPPIVLVAAVALTAINLALGTMKWLATLGAIESGAARPRFADAMTTTTIGALLGQVMPVQLGIALTRTVAARITREQSAGLALGATAYEQLFDVLVLIAAAAAGLVAWMAGRDILALLLPVLLIASACGMAATRLFVGLARSLAGIARLAPMGPARRRVLEASELAARAGRLPGRTVAAILAMSVLRYLSVLGRAIVLLAGLGLSGVAPAAAIAFPVIQGAGALPLTPGSLGVLEWTWSAVLTGAGASLEAAALFAVTVRIVAVAAQLATLALLGLSRIFLGRSARAPAVEALR